MKQLSTIVLILLCLAMVLLVVDCVNSSAPSDHSADGIPSDTSDRVPPVISCVEASDITATSATIKWDTDEFATSEVEFSGGGATQPTTVADDSLSKRHSMSLNALKPDTAYAYRVMSRDENGNGAASTEDTFRTLAQQPDIADMSPPVISQVSVSEITETSAAITWTTDEASTSRVSYCEFTLGSSDTNCDASPLDVTLVTSHEVTLTTLLPGTTYMYWVRSKDDAGNETELSDFFTTDVLVLGHAWAVADGTRPCLKVPFIATNRLSCTLFYGVGEDAVQVGYGTSDRGDTEVMVSMGASGRTPEGGTYRLLVDQVAYDYSPEHLPEYYFEFSGAEITVTGLDLTWEYGTSFSAYSLSAVAFDVINTGDLPVFIYSVWLDIGISKWDKLTVSPVVAVEPGQSQEVESAVLTTMFISNIAPGTYTLTFQLLDHSGWGFYTSAGLVGVP